MTEILKKIGPHIAAILIFLIATAVYFSPQLQGKAIRTGDITQYRGMSKEMTDFKKETGKTTLWTNAMFGGMPTYQISSVRSGNGLRIVDKVVKLWMSRPIGLFFSAMICFYILMISIGANPWLGVLGGIAWGFTTNNFILFEAGHMSKLGSLFYLPLMAAGVLLAFRKRQYLWGGLAFGIGTGLNLLANHIQMTYYLLLTLLIFGVAQLIFSYRKGEMQHFLKAAAFVIAGGLLAGGTAFSNLWITYDYAKSTTRGTPILQQAESAQSAQSNSEVDGLTWNYAMDYSMGYLDLFSTLIPRVIGGSNSEVLGSDSALRRFYAQRGQRLPDNFSAPSYWGSLKATGPNYFGAGVFLFFIMGIFLVKGPVKYWLSLGVLLTVMLSLGKNLEWFNSFLFDYFPLFNKFRTPNSVLSVTAFLVPFLGILGINELLKDDINKKKVLSALYISAGILGAICLFFLFMGPSMFDFSGLNDNFYETQYGINIAALIADRKAFMTGDATRSLIFVLLSGGLIWAFIQKYINKNVFLIALSLITVFDLWQVGRRYLTPDDFVSKSNVTNAFQARPVDQQIMADPDPNYRVHDLTIDVWNSAQASYFHKTIGGYHAAKLQRYQDVIERYLSRNDQNILNMLNAKYFIVPDQNGQPTAQLNQNALGNAWFVSTIKMVNSANEEIDGLANFAPATEAIVHQEFADYIQGLNPDGSGSIQLTQYEPNYLTYTSNSTSDQLAVFSEIWYGPNKGWQAYIDGKPVDHIRVNYILRALKIPAGQHTVEFKFEPRAYAIGTAVSAASSILLLAAAAFMAFKEVTRIRKEASTSQPAPKPTQKAPVKKKSTRASRDPKRKKKK
jgi:hypothetical protein